MVPLRHLESHIIHLALHLAECTDKPPPSDWSKNTCELQQAAGNCEKSWFRDHAEGYCHRTCGKCTPAPTTAALTEEGVLHAARLDAVYDHQHHPPCCTLRCHANLSRPGAWLLLQAAQRMPRQDESCHGMGFGYVGHGECRVWRQPERVRGSQEWARLVVWQYRQQLALRCCLDHCSPHYCRSNRSSALPL